MANKTSVNIGARLDRLPQSKWHVKIWLVTALHSWYAGQTVSAVPFRTFF
jgi:hypothetical protein